MFINKAVKNGIPISSANESEIQRYNCVCPFDFSGDVFFCKIQLFEEANYLEFSKSFEKARLKIVHTVGICTQRYGNLATSN